MDGCGHEDPQSILGERHGVSRVEHNSAYAVPFARLAELNAWGINSRTVYFTTSPRRFASNTSASGANSHSNCRHAPHGEVGISVSVTTATRLKQRKPSHTPRTIAARSAQIVRP